MKLDSVSLASILCFFSVYSTPSLAGHKSPFLSSLKLRTTAPLSKGIDWNTRRSAILTHSSHSVTLGARSVLQSSKNVRLLRRNSGNHFSLPRFFSFGLPKHENIKSPTDTSLTDVFISSEIIQSRKGTFIFPNEFDNYVFRPLIEDKTGVLISVGTFRTLFNSVMGQFSRVIMIDHDPLTTEFNEKNLNLIRDFSKTRLSLEAQRYQYLAVLHHRWLQPEDLEKVVNFKSNDHGKIKYLLSEIATYPELQLDQIPSEIQKSTLELQQAFLEAFGPRVPQSTPYSEDLNPFYRLSRIEKQNQMVYWGNNQSWHKIQTMIFENRFTTVSGDLTGDSTMKSISSELLRLGEAVSVIDISNVLEYLATHDKLEDDHSIERLLSNIKLFPKDSNALLLVTSLQYHFSLYKQLGLTDAGIFLNWYYLYRNLNDPSFFTNDISLEKEFEID